MLKVEPSIDSPHSVSNKNVWLRDVSSCYKCMLNNATLYEPLWGHFCHFPQSISCSGYLSRSDVCWHKAPASLTPPIHYFILPVPLCYHDLLLFCSLLSNLSSPPSVSPPMCSPRQNLCKWIINCCLNKGLICIHEPDLTLFGGLT